MARNFRLDWRGDQIKQTVVEAIKGGTTELGGRWETQAKGSIHPGRGVVTGTYRRSLHYANPQYNFASDNVRSGPGTPERAGQGGSAQQQGNSVILTIGSGVRYARILENLYNVVQGAFDQVKGQFGSILEKHAKRHGLT